MRSMVEGPAWLIPTARFPASRGCPSTVFDGPPPRSGEDKFCPLKPQAHDPS